MKGSETSDCSSQEGICNLHDLLAALTSDNPCAAQGINLVRQSCLSTSSSQSRRRGLKVSFNDEPVCHAVLAYSEIYGALPFNLFATSSGWKTVGPRANPYTGKSSEVMAARLAARSRHICQERISQHRHVTIRTANALLDGDEEVLDPPTVAQLLEKDTAANEFDSKDMALLISQSPDLED